MNTNLPYTTITSIYKAHRHKLTGNRSPSTSQTSVTKKLQVNILKMASISDKAMLTCYSILQLTLEFSRNTQSWQRWHFCTTSNGNKQIYICHSALNYNRTD